jgi:hypothetical protein
MFISLIKPTFRAVEAIAAARAWGLAGRLPSAIVSEKLGADCAAEKDFVGLSAYLSGMEAIWSYAIFGIS